MEKGENAGDQHFLLFPLCFPKPSCLELLNGGILWLRVKASADDKINVTETQLFFLEGLTALLEKEKVLVTSIFASSQNVYFDF